MSYGLRLKKIFILYCLVSTLYYTKYCDIKIELYKLESKYKLIPFF